MNVLLAQLILARGNGVGEWMNILVIVVVAVVYGLGAIIKAKGKKAQGQGEKQLTRRPTRKLAGGRGMLEQFFNELRSLAEPTQDRESRPTAQPTQPARQKTARPQTAFRKYAAEAKQAGRVQPRAPLARPKRPGLELSIQAPQVRPDFEELQEIETSTVEGLVGKRKGMADKVPELNYLSKVLADFTDPEDLRMAILHYEILGRPLSLRDPSGQIIGLKL